jgi:hypothetical protein
MNSRLYTFRIYVDLDDSGSYCGAGYMSFQFGEIVGEWVAPDLGPFATAAEALAYVRSAVDEYYGEQLSLF